MADIGDLQVRITGDASGLTAAAAEGRKQIDQTITHVQRSEQSWSSMGVSAVESTTRIVGPIIALIAAAQRAQAAAAVNAAAANSMAASTTTMVGVTSAAATPPTLTFAAAMAFLTAPVTLIVAGLTAAAAAIYYFSGSADEASASTEAAGDAATSTAHKFGAMEVAAKALAKAQEELKASTATTGDALSAMEIATRSLKGGLFPEDTGAQLREVAVEAANVQQSWGNLKATLEQPFVDAGLALGRFLADMLGIKSAAQTAAAGLRVLNDGINWLKDNSKTAITALTVLAHSHATGESLEASQAYVAEGEALVQLAAATEKAIARQEEQRNGYRLFAQQMAEATADAAHHAEVQKIGSTTTIEGLDDQLRALQKRAAAEITAEGNAVAALKARGASEEDLKALQEANGEAAKKRGELLNALESQRNGILSGRVQPKESGIDSAINAAKAALLGMVEGKDAAAIAALRAKAATEEERAAVEAGIPAYLAAQHAIRELTAQREADKLAMDARNQLAAAAQSLDQQSSNTITGLRDKIDVLSGSATQAEIAMRELARQGFPAETTEEISRLNAELEQLAQAQKGTDKITALKDQIDLLNGSATAAEIAMRELSRAGFSDDQIAEIGALTAELDQLKESQKKTTGAKQPEVKAAFQGSKEAAEIMLRGVGGGTKLEKLGEQQLAELKRISGAQQQQPAKANPPNATKVPTPPPVTLAVPPLPAPPALPPALPPAPEMTAPRAATEPSASTPVTTAPPALPVPTFVPPAALAPDLSPESVASLPTPQPSESPLKDKRSANLSRLAEADAARDRAEQAARRAGLNEAQIKNAGQDAWTQSERSTAARMEKFTSSAAVAPKAEPTSVAKPSPQIPTATPTVPATPVNVSPPSINVAAAKPLPLVAPNVNVATAKLPTISPSVSVPKPTTIVSPPPPISLPSLPQPAAPVVNVPPSPAIAVESPKVSIPPIALPKFPPLAASVTARVPEVTAPKIAAPKLPDMPPVTTNVTATVPPITAPTLTAPQLPEFPPIKPPQMGPLPEFPEIKSPQFAAEDVASTKSPTAPQPVAVPNITLPAFPPLPLFPPLPELPPWPPMPEIRYANTPQKMGPDAPDKSETNAPKLPSSVTTFEPVEMPKPRTADLSQFSGVSVKAESRLKDQSGEKDLNTKGLEKLLTMLLAEQKTNTAAVKANKPAQLAVGSV